MSHLVTAPDHAATAAACMRSPTPGPQCGCGRPGHNLLAAAGDEVSAQRRPKFSAYVAGVRRSSSRPRRSVGRVHRRWIAGNAYAHAEAANARVSHALDTINAPIRRC